MIRRALATARARRIAAAVLALAVLAGATAGFLALRGGEDADDAPIPAPQRVSQAGGLTRVTLTAAQARQAGIRTQPVQPGSWRVPLSAYGTVLDLQPLVALAGRLAAAHAQLAAAQARAGGARLALARARTLFADAQNLSAAQLEAAQTSERAEQAGLAAARSEADSLAAAAQLDWGPVLKDALVKGTALLTDLTAGRARLLQVTLPPGEHAGRAEGAFAQAEDGSHIPLRLVSPAARADPRLPGTGLLFTAAAGGELLPGMTVRVFLPGTRVLTGVLIPPQAVVWTQGGAWAYFREGTGFVRRAVPADAALPDGYAVPASAGGEAVVQGAQLLLSEEQRADVRVSD